MADIKNFGLKGVSSDVQFGKSGGRFVYDSGNTRFNVTASDGTTLEEIQFGNVTAGNWQGDVVSSQYGGTGQNFSAGTGYLLFTNGVATLESGITGDINGDLTGNVLAANGNVVLANGTDGSDAVFTGTVVGSASSLTTAGTISLSGNVSATGVTYTSGGNIVLSTELETIAGLTADTYGDAGNIAVFTVDQYGRITSASEVAVASTLNIAGNTGTDGVSLLNDTLSVVGVTNQTTTTVTDNQIAVGLTDSVTITDSLTVTNTTTTKDMVVSGNLTVSGTTTTINTTETEIQDNVIRVNTLGALNTPAGLEANVTGASGTSIESLKYDPLAVISPDTLDTGAWVVSDDMIVNGDGKFDGNVVITGTLTADISGAADSLANTGNIQLSGNVISTAYLYTSGGDITIASELEVVNAGSVGTFGDAGNISVFTVDKYGRITSASEVAVASTLSLSGDTGTDDVALLTDTVEFVGGTNINSVVADGGAANTSVTFNLDSDVLGLTSLTVDNVSIDGNTISSTNTNGDLILAPNGTGEVIIGNSGLPAELVAEDEQSLTLGGGTSTTANAAGDLLLNGGDNTGTGDAGDVIVQAGTATSGTNGSTLFNDANGTTLMTISGGEVSLDPAYDVDAASANSLVDKGWVTGYVSTQLATSNLVFSTPDNSYSANVDLSTESFRFDGDDNITVSGSLSGTEEIIAITLDDTISIGNVNLTGALTATGTVTGGTLTDGTATITGGTLSTTGNVTANVVSFTSLSDGTDTITGFETSTDTLTDSDTAVPTSAAVKDYVDTKAGDGLLLRVGGISATSAVGTVPSVAGRAYYADKAVINVTSAFSAGATMTISDGTTTYVVAADSDLEATGLYYVDLSGLTALVAGATVTATISGTGGTADVSLHYNWIVT